MPAQDDMKRMLGRVLGGLVQVGNRALGAAIKSAAKDVKREIKKAEKRVQEIVDVVDEVAPQVADDGDEPRVIEAELVDEPQPKRKRRK